MRSNSVEVSNYSQLIYYKKILFPYSYTPDVWVGNGYVVTTNSVLNINNTSITFYNNFTNPRIAVSGSSPLSIIKSVLYCDGACDTNSAISMSGGALTIKGSTFDYFGKFIDYTTNSNGDIVIGDTGTTNKNTFSGGCLGGLIFGGPTGVNLFKIINNELFVSSGYSSVPCISAQPAIKVNNGGGSGSSGLQVSSNLIGSGDAIGSRWTNGISLTQTTTTSTIFGNLIYNFIQNGVSVVGKSYNPGEGQTFITSNTIDSVYDEENGIIIDYENNAQLVGNVVRNVTLDNKACVSISHSSNVMLTGNGYAAPNPDFKDCSVGIAANSSNSLQIKSTKIDISETVPSGRLQAPYGIKVNNSSNTTIGGSLTSDRVLLNNATYGIASQSNSGFSVKNSEIHIHAETACFGQANYKNPYGISLNSSSNSFVYNNYFYFDGLPQSCPNSYSAFNAVGILADGGNSEISTNYIYSLGKTMPYYNYPDATWSRGISLSNSFDVVHDNHISSNIRDSSTTPPAGYYGIDTAIQIVNPNASRFSYNTISGVYHGFQLTASSASTIYNIFRNSITDSLSGMAFHPPSASGEVGCNTINLLGNHIDDPIRAFTIYPSLAQTFIIGGSTKSNKIIVPPRSPANSYFFQISVATPTEQCNTNTISSYNWMSTINSGNGLNAPNNFSQITNCPGTVLSNSNPQTIAWTSVQQLCQTSP